MNSTCTMCLWALINSFLLCMVHLDYFTTTCTGDPEKDEKAGLYILCKVLSKKGASNTLVYIYEECKVHVNSYRAAFLASFPKH